MTCPVYEPQKPRRKRSALKRQRMAILISLIVVALLAGSFAVVYHFTSRTTFLDADNETEYYIVEVDGIYVIQDAEGNTLSTTLEATSNYAVANRIIIVGAGTDVEAAADSTDSFVPVEIPEEALTNDGQPVTVTADEIAGDQ